MVVVMAVLMVAWSGCSRVALMVELMDERWVG